MNKRTFYRIKEGLDELRDNIPAIVEDTLRPASENHGRAEKCGKAEKKEAK